MDCVALKFWKGWLGSLSACPLLVRVWRSERFLPIALVHDLGIVRYRTKNRRILPHYFTIFSYYLLNNEVIGQVFFPSHVDLQKESGANYEWRKQYIDVFSDKSSRSRFLFGRWKFVVYFNDAKCTNKLKFVRTITYVVGKSCPIRENSFPFKNQ